MSGRWEWSSRGVRGKVGEMHYARARQILLSGAYREYAVGDAVMLSKLGDADDCDGPMDPADVYLAQIVDMYEDRSDPHPEAEFDHMKVTLRWFYWSEDPESDQAAISRREGADDPAHDLLREDFFFSDHIESDPNSVEAIVGRALLCPSIELLGSYRNRLKKGVASGVAAMNAKAESGAKGLVELAHAAVDSVFLVRWFYENANEDADVSVRLLPRGCLTFLLAHHTQDTMYRKAISYTSPTAGAKRVEDAEGEAGADVDDDTPLAHLAGRPAQQGGASVPRRSPTLPTPETRKRPASTVDGVGAHAKKQRQPLPPRPPAKKRKLAPGAGQKVRPSSAGGEGGSAPTIAAPAEASAEPAKGDGKPNHVGKRPHTAEGDVGESGKPKRGGGEEATQDDADPPPVVMDSKSMSIIRDMTAALANLGVERSKRLLPALWKLLLSEIQEIAAERGGTDALQVDDPAFAAELVRRTEARRAAEAAGAASCPASAAEGGAPEADAAASSAGAAGTAVGD